MHESHVLRNGVGNHCPAFPYHTLLYYINRQIPITMRSWRHDNLLSTVNCNIRLRPLCELLLLTIWCTICNRSWFRFTVHFEKNIYIQTNVICVWLGSGHFSACFRWVLAWFTFLPWRWRLYMPPKHVFYELHGDTIQNRVIRLVFILRAGLTFIPTTRLVCGGGGRRWDKSSPGSH
jgi:hypothetical protein